MESKSSLAVVLVFMLNMVVVCYGTLHHRPFSDLKNNLIVEATTNKTGALQAGVDKITLKWGPSTNVTKTDDSTYQTVKIKLCYTPISQKDRPWRKTVLDNIAKDKTCQFDIVNTDYTRVTNNGTYLIGRDIPGAVFFIRAYAFDAHNQPQAYGNTSLDKPFTVIGVSGRSISIDFAASVFSAFSLVSLGFFFYNEKRKATTTVGTI